MHPNSLLLGEDRPLRFEAWEHHLTVIINLFVDDLIDVAVAVGALEVQGEL